MPVGFDGGRVVEGGGRDRGVAVEPSRHQHGVESSGFGFEGGGGVVGVQAVGGPLTGGRLGGRVDDVFGPEHQIDRRDDPGGGLELVGEHDRRSGRGGPCPLRSSALDHGHVEFTDDMPGGGQRSEHPAHDDRGEGDGCGDDGTGPGPATIGEGAQADPDHDDEGDEQEGSADPDHGGERATCLAHRQGRQRNAAEGNAPPHELGQGDRSHQPEASPVAGRHENGRQPEEGAVEDDDDQPTRWREVPHPEGAGSQPRSSHQHRPGASTAGRLVGEQPIEDGDAGEGHRPPAPRRDRGGQQQPGQQGECDGALAGGHAGQPIRGPSRWIPPMGPTPRMSTSSTSSTCIQSGRSSTSQWARISPGSATLHSFAARLTGSPM